MARIAKGFSSRYVLSVLRIISAFTFTLHGAQKFGAFGGLGSHRLVPFSLLWVAALLEVVGGPLLFVGLFTRPVAFLLSGEMAFGYFLSHAPKGLWPNRNGGELAVLYCFLFLYFVAAGGGPISLDRVLRKRE